MFARHTVMAALAAAMFALAAPGVLSADAKAEAEKHFKAGVSLLEAEDWPAAAAEFETSTRLYPTKMGLFNLANAYRAMHRYQEALDTVDRIDRDFPKKLDPEFKDAMAELRREIRGMVGHLRVRVEEAGAEIAVDGRVVGKSPLEPFVLAPGEHQVEVSLSGYVAQRRAVRITVGETAKEKFDLEREEAAAAVVPVPVPTPAPAPAPAQPAAGGPTIKPVPSLAEPVAEEEEKPSSVDSTKRWTVGQAIDALRSPDKLIRLAGLHRLAAEPGPQVQTRIATTARFDPEPRIRYEAVKALGARREEASLAILRSIALNDKDGKVRAAARLAVSMASPSSTGALPQRSTAGQVGASQTFDVEDTGATETDLGHPYAFFWVAFTGTVFSGALAIVFGASAANKRESADQVTQEAHRKASIGFGVTTGVLGATALIGLIAGYQKNNSSTDTGTEPEVSAVPGGLAVSF